MLKQFITIFIMVFNIFSSDLCQLHYQAVFVINVEFNLKCEAKFWFQCCQKTPQCNSSFFAKLPNQSNTKESQTMHDISFEFDQKHFQLYRTSINQIYEDQVLTTKKDNEEKYIVYEQWEIDQITKEIDQSGDKLNISAKCIVKEEKQENKADPVQEQVQPQNQNTQQKQDGETVNHIDLTQEQTDVNGDKPEEVDINQNRDKILYKYQYVIIRNLEQDFNYSDFQLEDLDQGDKLHYKIEVEEEKEI